MEHMNKIIPAVFLAIAVFTAGCVAPDTPPSGHPMTIPAGAAIPHLAMADASAMGSLEDFVLRLFDDLNSQRSGTVAGYLFSIDTLPGDRAEMQEKVRKDWTGLRFSNISVQETMEMGICGFIQNETIRAYCNSHVTGSYVVTVSYTAARRPAPAGSGEPGRKEDSFLVLRTDEGWRLMLPPG